MIATHENKQIILCDGCDRIEPISRTTPLRWIDRHRWKINRKNQGWQHFCPSCKREFLPLSLSEEE